MEYTIWFCCFLPFFLAYFNPAEAGLRRRLTPESARIHPYSSSYPSYDTGSFSGTSGGVSSGTSYATAAHDHSPSYSSGMYPHSTSSSSYTTPLSYSSSYSTLPSYSSPLQSVSPSSSHYSDSSASRLSHSSYRSTTTPSYYDSYGTVSYSPSPVRSASPYGSFSSTPYASSPSYSFSSSYPSYTSSSYMSSTSSSSSPSYNPSYAGVSSTTAYPSSTSYNGSISTDYQAMLSAAPVSSPSSPLSDSPAPHTTESAAALNQASITTSADEDVNPLRPTPRRTRPNVADLSYHNSRDSATESPVSDGGVTWRRGAVQDVLFDGEESIVLDIDADRIQDRAEEYNADVSVEETSVALPRDTISTSAESNAEAAAETEIESNDPENEGPVESATVVEPVSPTTTETVIESVGAGNQADEGLAQEVSATAYDSEEYVSASSSGEPVTRATDIYDNGDGNDAGVLPESDHIVAIEAPESQPVDAGVLPETAESALGQDSESVSADSTVVDTVALAATYTVEDSIIADEQVFPDAERHSLVTIESAAIESADTADGNDTAAEAFLTASSAADNGIAAHDVALPDLSSNNPVQLTARSSIDEFASGDAGVRPDSASIPVEAAEQITEAAAENITGLDADDNSEEPIAPEQITEAAAENITELDADDNSEEPIAPEQITEAAAENITGLDADDNSEEPIAPEQITEAAPENITELDADDNSEEPIAPEQITEAAAENITGLDADDNSEEPIAAEQITEAAAENITELDADDNSEEPIAADDGLIPNATANDLEQSEMLDVVIKTAETITEDRGNSHTISDTTSSSTDVEDRVHANVTGDGLGGLELFNGIYVEENTVFESGVLPDTEMQPVVESTKNTESLTAAEEALLPDTLKTAEESDVVDGGHRDAMETDVTMSGPSGVKEASNEISSEFTVNIDNAPLSEAIESDLNTTQEASLTNYAETLPDFIQSDSDVIGQSAEDAAENIVDAGAHPDSAGSGIDMPELSVEASHESVVVSGGNTVNVAVEDTAENASKLTAGTDDGVHSDLADGGFNLGDQSEQNRIISDAEMVNTAETTDDNPVDLQLVASITDPAVESEVPL